MDSPFKLLGDDRENDTLTLHLSQVLSNPGPHKIHEPELENEEEEEVTVCLLHDFLS